jgi:hypothetical protein
MCVGTFPLTAVHHGCARNCCHIQESVGMPSGVVRQPWGRRRYASIVWPAVLRLGVWRPVATASRWNGIERSSVVTWTIPSIVSQTAMACAKSAS